MHADRLQHKKKHDCWSGATVTYMPDGLVQLCSPARWLGTSIGNIPDPCCLSYYDCGSEASVTDIPAGSAPYIQMCLQLFTEEHACIRCAKWSGAAVTNMPAVSEQS